MFMRGAFRSLSILFCMLLFISIAAAHEITIGRSAKVGSGSELQPGTYRVEVVKNQDGADVQFYHGHELVVTAPATITKEFAKCGVTEVHSEQLNGRQVMTKIWLKGSEESLLFK